MKKIYLTISILVSGILSQAQDCSRYQIINLKDSVIQGHSYVYFEMTVDTALLQNTGYTDLFFVDNSNDTITTYGNWGYLIPESIHGLDTLNYLIRYRTGITNFPNTFSGFLMMRNPSCDIPFDNIVEGVENLEVNSASIYPNPVHGLLHIDSRNHEIEKVELFDTYGRLIRSQRNSDLTIDMSLLDSGIYYLVMSFTNKEITRKKVIKN